MLSFIAQPGTTLAVPLTDSPRPAIAPRSTDELALEALQTGRAFAEYQEPLPDDDLDLAAWVHAPELLPLPRVTADLSN